MHAIEDALGDNWVAVCTGDLCVCQAIIHWFISADRVLTSYPKCEEGTSVIFFNTKGELYQLCDVPALLKILETEMHAFGSGAQAALAVLRNYRAETAMDAIITASTVDVYTAPSGHFARIENGSFIIKAFDAVPTGVEL